MTALTRRRLVRLRNHASTILAAIVGGVLAILFANFMKGSS